MAFTSGAFAGSVAQANYAAAKGGIVSLVRSAAAGLNRYGITANAVAPVARTRMTAEVPMDLAEMGDPEDVAPLVVYLLSDQAKHVTGQVYTSVGPKIAVWNQPREVRAVYADGRWTPGRSPPGWTHGGAGAHAAPRPARGLSQGGRGQSRGGGGSGRRRLSVAEHAEFVALGSAITSQSSRPVCPTEI